MDYSLRGRNSKEEIRTMIANVRARFSNGALTPLEPLELEEGMEVTLSIIEMEDKTHSSLRQPQSEEGNSPVSETHSVIAMIDRLRAEFPVSERENAPADGAKNYKHYLYGHPKEE